MAEVKLIADQIRRDFPTAIIYMNEAPDVLMCGYSKQNMTLFKEDECIPQNVDWIGFDFYHGDASSWIDVEEAYKHVCAIHYFFGGAIYCVTHHIQPLATL